MNGKGSGRRPALVSSKVVAANWRRTFGSTQKPKKPKKATKQGVTWADRTLAALTVDDLMRGSHA